MQLNKGRPYGQPTGGRWVPPTECVKEWLKNAFEGLVQLGADAAPAGVKSDGVRKCSFAVEWSRHHILCRTGEKGPGGSFAMSYGVGKQYPNVEAAKAAADEWLKAERARAALEVAGR